MMAFRRAANLAIDIAIVNSYLSKVINQDLISSLNLKYLRLLAQVIQFYLTRSLTVD